MGAPAVHAKISGVADVEAADDAECLRLVRAYLSFMPSRYGDPLPLRPASDPPDRRSEKLYEIVPANLRKAYDMRRVIKEIADDGEFFAIKPDWAKALITGFARFGGRPAAILVSQPMVRAGRYLRGRGGYSGEVHQIRDAFGIPPVFLVDVPGFVVGREVEHRGILRHGAKFLHNISCATVPKVTVILRKAYGAGYYVMGGPAVRGRLHRGLADRGDLDHGTEGAVNILFRRQLAAAEPGEAQEALRQDLARDRARANPSVSDCQAGTYRRHRGSCGHPGGISSAAWRCPSASGLWRQRRKRGVIPRNTFCDKPYVRSAAACAAAGPDLRGRESMGVPWPTGGQTRWRCTRCGNLTQVRCHQNGPLP